MTDDELTAIEHAAADHCIAVYHGQTEDPFVTICRLCVEVRRLRQRLADVDNPTVLYIGDDLPEGAERGVRRESPLDASDVEANK